MLHAIIGAVSSTFVTVSRMLQDLTSTMRPLGKPPPSAMSRVRAPEEM